MPTPDDAQSTSNSPRGWNPFRWLLGPDAPATESGKDASPLASGHVGKYRVIDIIGEGGMGRVHVAEDEKLRRKVALKMLKSDDESSRRRFLREARAAARVSHPRLCPIYEVGEHDGQPFIVMELLDGETLAARLVRGPIPVQEVLAIADDLLEGLAALHDAGLVHRDVKPSNLFLTQHGTRLVDFGLATKLDEDINATIDVTRTLTSPGAIMGTPGYMAPEQIVGEDVDARADLFAAGALLHQALSGRHAFAGNSAAALLSSTLYGDPQPLVGSPALTALNAPLQRALAKKPAERFSTAREMASALREAFAAGAVPVAEPSADSCVGRRQELAWLEERFNAAVVGAGGIVFVTGDRGTGKSAVVGEFLRRVRSRPVTVVSGRCTETEGPSEPFLPFHDAIGRLLTSSGRDTAAALLRTYAPTICVQMASGVLPDPDGSLRRQATGATKERLIREAGDFMEAACRTFPIVLLVEDLQWADPASMDLLRHVGSRFVRQRTLLIATFRQSDVDAGNPYVRRCATDLLASGAARELTLGPLTESEVGEYFDARFPGHRFPAALATAVHVRTEGLALFMRSLVDVLVERGDIVRQDDVFALARPLNEVDLEPAAGLRDFVRRQLEGLAPSERDILRCASVTGREFLSPIVAHLVKRSVSDVEEDLRQLARVRRLVVEADEETLPDGTIAARYRFAHGLYPAVLREDLVPSRRLAWHREVAARLRHHWGADAPRIAGEIAWHYEQAHDAQNAVHFRGHAGDNAVRTFAYAEAEEHYNWAFRSYEKLPAEARPAAAISLRWRRARVRLMQSRFDEAVTDFEAVLAAARATSEGPAERAALSGLCDALFFSQRVEETSVRAHEFLEAATAAGAEDDVQEARARIGSILTCEGKLSEAGPLLDDVIARARQGGMRTALKIGLAYRMVVHYWQTEYQQSERATEEAIVASLDDDDGFYALAGSMFLGLSRANLGKVSDALVVFNDSIAQARRNDDRYWMPRLLSHLGWIHRQLGAFAIAREWDTQAVALAREGQAWGPESEALLNLCADDVSSGRAEEAAAVLADLEKKATQGSWMRWVSDLRVASAMADHWVARSEHYCADQEAQRLATLADGLRSRDYRCSAERIRAGAALATGTGLEEAASRLTGTIKALDETPAPLERWKSARMLAAVKHKLGDIEGARAALADSRAAIDVIVAGTREPALRDSFEALPGVRAVREGRFE